MEIQNAAKGLEVKKMKTKLRSIVTWSVVGIALLFLIASVDAIDVSVGTSNSTFLKLQKDIEEVPYETFEYVTDVFDCSNMAGMLTDHLDDAGYDAELVIVHSKVDRTCYHTFVIVDRKVIIEPTYKLITFSEMEYGDYNTDSIDWYMETWDIVGIYTNKEDAAKNSRWNIYQFDSTLKDLRL